MELLARWSMQRLESLVLRTSSYSRTFWLRQQRTAVAVHTQLGVGEPNWSACCSPQKLTPFSGRSESSTAEGPARSFVVVLEVHSATRL